MSVPQEAGTDAAALLALELEKDDLELPLLPDVAAEVLASSADENSDAGQLAQLIERDQSLASHILRVINSPVFRGNVEIVSLKQAIARVGIEGIREIAVAVALKSALQKATPFDRLINASWRLGLATAIWSRELARAVVKNVEMAYLSGLLHNIGVPLLAHLAHESSVEVSEQDFERVLTDLGPRASEKLIESWHLPEVVASTVRALGQPSWEEDAGAHILRVAIYIASSDASLDAESLVGDSSVQALNLYPDDVEALLERREQVDAVIESMS